VQSLEIDRLARSFADAADTFLALVEGLEVSRWEEPSVEDGRPIGTIAHHVALGYAIGHWRVVAAASGYPQPLQQGSADERNAAHAAASPAPDRAATVALLAKGAAALEVAIRSLRASQLADEIAVGAFKGTIASLVASCRRHFLEHEATIRNAKWRVNCRPEPRETNSRTTCLTSPSRSASASAKRDRESVLHLDAWRLRTSTVRGAFCSDLRFSGAQQFVQPHLSSEAVCPLQRPV